MSRTSDPMYAFGPYVLDERQGTLRRQHELVNLSPKIFKTLCLLAAERGELVPKSALIERLWPDSYVEERSLTQNIFLLRKALGKTPEGAEYVQTLSRRGYRMAVPVILKSVREAPADAESRSAGPPRMVREPGPAPLPLRRPMQLGAEPGRWRPLRHVALGVALLAALAGSLRIKARP